MAQAYEQKKDPDGFLYITYTEESTLGAADLQFHSWDSIIVNLNLGVNEGVRHWVVNWSRNVKAS